MTATITFCSSIHDAAIGGVATTFACSKTVATLGLTTFLLGFATGPLLFAPLSEVWGRILVFRITLFLFFCFNLGCALAPTIEALLVFRFLCGFFGSPVGKFYALVQPQVAKLIICSDQYWWLSSRYLATNSSVRAICPIYHRELTWTCYCTNCWRFHLAGELTLTDLLLKTKLILLKYLTWRW